MRKIIIAVAVIAMTAVSALSLTEPAQAFKVKAGSDSSLDAGDLKVHHRDVLDMDMSLGELGAAAAAF